MKNSFFSYDKGSVLIEILLSVMIMSVSLTLIIQSMASSLRAVVISSEYAQGMILLENKMCEILSKRDIHENLGAQTMFLLGKEYRVIVNAKQIDAIKVDEQNFVYVNDLDISLAWIKSQKRNRIMLQTYLFTTQ